MSEDSKGAQAVYEEKYVAFLDLLGFKSQVEAAERDMVAHEKLRTVLQLVQEVLVRESEDQLPPQLFFGLHRTVRGANADRLA